MVLFQVVVIDITIDEKDTFNSCWQFGQCATLIDLNQSGVIIYNLYIISIYYDIFLCLQ